MDRLFDNNWHSRYEIVRKYNWIDSSTETKEHYNGVMQGNTPVKQCPTTTEAHV